LLVCPATYYCREDAKRIQDFFVEVRLIHFGIPNIQEKLAEVSIEVIQQPPRPFVGRRAQAVKQG
jgi:hypothetical protein